MNEPSGQPASCPSTSTLCHPRKYCQPTLCSSPRTIFYLSLPRIAAAPAIHVVGNKTEPIGLLQTVPTAPDCRSMKVHIGRDTGTVMAMEWREPRKLQTPHESRFSTSFCEGNIVSTQQLCMFRMSLCEWPHQSVNFIFDHDCLVADRAE